MAAGLVRSGEDPTGEVAAPGGQGGLGQRDDRHPLVRAETLGGGDQPVQASGGGLQVSHQPHGDLGLVAETVPLQLGSQRPQQPLDQVVVLHADADERGGLPLVEQAVVLPHAQLAQVGEVHLRLDPRLLPRQPRVGGERPAEEAGEFPVTVADLAECLDPGGEQPTPQRQPGRGIARQPPVLVIEEPLERLRDPVAAAATPPRPRRLIGEPRVRRRWRGREALPVAVQRSAP